MASTSTTKKKKPGKQPQDRYRPSAWKTNSKPEDVELPSGNVCLARRPGPVEILQSGLMPDSLMPLITKAINDGEGRAEKNISKEITDDPEKLLEVMEGMDKAMATIIVEPAVLYHKEADEEGKWVTIPHAERDNENFIYTDEIDMEDKLFLFNFAVGGTRDLERFRVEHSERVGMLADEPSSEEVPE